MTLLTAFELLNYGLILLFGVFLSTEIAGGWDGREQRRRILILCPFLLLLQAVLLFLYDAELIRQLYPLIVHLPLMLMLIFVLKKRLGVALVSVCTAYLCCQLPHWVELTAASASGSPLLGEICYTLSILPVFALLRRFFIRAAHSVMAYSSRSLLLFGSLPLAYYLFDYATAVYSNALQVHGRVINELLPTALIVFYVLFLTAYHVQMQERTQNELQRSMLEAELEQSRVEMEGLRYIEAQTAVYQHDMRHHLNAIDGFLAADKPQQAMEYIQKVRSDVEAITLKRFCENEMVNLLCSAFETRAERLGIALSIDVNVPQEVSISDTELCSLLSNGLENALNAVVKLEGQRNWVDFYCGVNRNKLLIEIKNPCAGNVILRDGVPVSREEGHGYGCRSIRMIVERYQGVCSFEAANEIFTLHAVLPVIAAEAAEAEC